MEKVWDRGSTENRPLNHRLFNESGTIGKSREPKNPSIPIQVNNINLRGWYFGRVVADVSQPDVPLKLF